MQGAGWGFTWECTTNEPVDEVLLVGSCGLSPASACGTTGSIVVASITFDLLRPGFNTFGGFISRLTDGSTDLRNVDVVAGAGILRVEGARRRSLAAPPLWTTTPSSSDPTPAMPSSLRWPQRKPTAAQQPWMMRAMTVDARLGGPERSWRKSRKLLEDGSHCGAVKGDTNGDCVFDILDVQYLQLFIGGSVDEADLSPAQAAAMDPDGDGDTDGVDISYLIKVVAGKVHHAERLTSLSTRVLVERDALLVCRAGESSSQRPGGSEEP